MSKKKLRALDLYSGIGGWTLGLEMAGIQVVRCYEWWSPAIQTYNNNHNPVARSQNIRELDPTEIDCAGIDIVVGSPPCTQFSYSNRGGSGDIQDGLKDIAKFLEVVDYLKPTYWAMENVPRVAGILRNELAPGGELEKYAHLVEIIEVVDASRFGLPQRRKRMIAGRFPFGLFNSYSNELPERTLGDALQSLWSKQPCDPLYKFNGCEITEMENEHPLDNEEIRLNREAKRFHPIYNKMSFPDDLNRPARTVTALCTRVSRESIVIEDLCSLREYRRLNIRERGCLQGFPVSYQFFGKSCSEKAKMIGNAIPPVLTFYLAHSMLQTKLEQVPDLQNVLPPNRLPEATPPVTPVSNPGRTFPKTRKFRAAIPNLRFGSGMRFELTNSFVESAPSWQVGFYYGSSKEIQSIGLSKELLKDALDSVAQRQFANNFSKKTEQISEFLSESNLGLLQDSWTHRIDAVGPFDVCDLLGEAVGYIETILPNSFSHQVTEFVLRQCSYSVTDSPKNGAKKIALNSSTIFCGFLIGSWFNSTGVSLLTQQKKAA